MHSNANEAGSHMDYYNVRQPGRSEQHLQFRNSAGRFFDGNIGTDKDVSGWAEELSFSMSYSPPSRK